MLTLALLSIAAIQEPRPLPTTLAEVTVFPGSALVQRNANAPSGTGKYVIAGLPQSMDPESIRVRCTGAEVIGLETRERFERAVPDERVQELRERIAATERELAGLADERDVLARVHAHLQALVNPREVADAAKQATAVSLDTWTKNVEYLTAQLTKTRTALRENGWKQADVQERLDGLKRELARGGSSSGVHLRDVIVELDGGNGPASLQLGYIVGSAGWRPMYDMRTAPDAKSVDLSYRAQVWQQSGEDWNDVSLALSTAEPQRGAQGPDPRPVWLRIREPQANLDDLRALGYSSDAEVTAGLVEKEASLAAPGSPPANPYATVENQGLSVRFRVATRETVQSRAEPSTVLVGQAKLDVSPEYYAAPELDTNVWLRGKATNTTPWVLLRGVAAVYFGADYLGHAAIDAVQPGEEFTLHLGPDPALVIERKQLEDLTAPPSGIFGGSRTTHRESFRVRIKNNGAAAAQSDGSAIVWVREGLPRATDERIKVELLDPKPAVSTDERWKKDREEQGIVTWAIRAPRGGEALLEYAIKVSYPEGARVRER